MRLPLSNHPTTMTVLKGHGTWGDLSCPHFPKHSQQVAASIPIDFPN
jgi:hypothetical protein